MNKSGRLIVFEGINAAGKTSLIQELLKSRTEWIYVKGLGDKTTASGRFARRFPSTLTMLLELLISNLTVVRPALKAGKTILHDRYFTSIMIFHTASRWHNRLLGKIFRPLLAAPDLSFLINVSTEESLRRMREEVVNPFHNFYFEHPEFIDKERDLFKKLLPTAIIIDTTNLKLTEAVPKVLQQIGGPANGKNRK